MPISLDQLNDVRRRLFSEHNASSYGVWQIFGEDANADMCGRRSIPNLGLVEGTYREAVDYALGLKSFFAWGRGGHITPGVAPQVKKIDKISLNKEKIAKLEESKSQLLKEINKINAQIDTLTGNQTKTEPAKDYNADQ